MSPWLRLRSKDKKDAEKTVSKNGNLKSNNSTDENDDDFEGDENGDDQDVSLIKKKGCCLM